LYGSIPSKLRFLALNSGGPYSLLWASREKQPRAETDYQQTKH
jgi:hypothetical protein